MIHFAHANGFPSACYKVMLTELKVKYDLKYVSMLGHDHEYPLDDNWSSLVEEVLDSITTQFDQPIVGVGHSLGGVVILLAACRRPELFKQVIMLDAPVFGFLKSMMIRLIKALNLIHLVTPSKQASRRKTRWESIEKAKQYFLEKPLYQSFEPECLEDYLQNALLIDENGQCRLKFSREIESHIFKTVPHFVYKHIKNLSVPVSLIYSDSSHIIAPYELRIMRKKFNIQTYACLGSHLFPFEYPKQAANLIDKAIQNIQGRREN